MIAGIGLTILLLVLIGFAVADVFWPIGLVSVVAVVALLWIGNETFWFVLTHPLWIVYYFAAAFVWIFFRWMRFVEKEFKRSKDRPSVSKPVWSDHSWDYSAYFFFWPIDLVAYFLTDILNDLWKMISAMIAASFNSYVEWRFRR